MDLKKGIEMSESNSNWRSLYKIAGVATIILLIYSLATMLIMFGAGVPPATANEILEMLSQNQLMGLLRLDALTTLVMPLYYLLFLSLFIALRKSHEVGATITLLLGSAGLTLFLAAPSFISWMVLSEKFAIADQAQKTLLLAAGETILATDLWHSSSAFVGGLLLQTSMLLISLVMLRSNTFSKLTAWVGVVTHSLDLAHIPFLLFFPTIGTILMIFGGTLYLVWFPLLARDFFHLAKSGGLENTAD
jgi:hypothetical protein